VTFLRNVKLIQGGMGVHVSNWRLARAVALERPGATAGTVSGTALDVVHARLLQLGAPGGHTRRALQALDETLGCSVGASILDRYFIEGGKAPAARFKNTPMHLLRASNGASSFARPGDEPAPVPLTLNDETVELLIATAFAEVWLAKEGHGGNIFINFLNKIELPLLYALYGAMLAGVDGVVVGAGNPDGLPAICSRLARHEPVRRPVSTLYRESSEEFTLDFDPRQVAGGALRRARLRRPAFLAIVSLEDLVKSLARSASEAPDGFVIEHHTAGGHNANPIGPLRRDELGQPIYGERDEADLAAIREVETAFWLAGGYGSHEGLQRALAAGATGIQVGSAFALAEESGMKADYRTAILQAFRNGTDDAALVRTTMFRPRGFPSRSRSWREPCRSRTCSRRGPGCATSASSSSGASAGPARTERARSCTAARPAPWGCSSTGAGSSGAPSSGGASATVCWPASASARFASTTVSTRRSPPSSRSGTTWMARDGSRGRGRPATGPGTSSRTS
jgi:nitronate monooxygenase